MSGDTSQTCCPWNARFARELQVPEFAPREFLRDKEARQLARDLLQMTQAEFSAAFKGSPMKRAKLRALKRNSAVVLGNVGSAEDVPALAAALSDDEPLVRAHSAWALRRLGFSASALRAQTDAEEDLIARAELSDALAPIKTRAVTTADDVA